MEKGVNRGKGREDKGVRKSARDREGRGYGQRQR